MDPLSNITEIRITGESRTGISETSAIDNPRIYQCLPRFVRPLFVITGRSGVLFLPPGPPPPGG